MKSFQRTLNIQMQRHTVRDTFPVFWLISTYPRLATTRRWKSIYQQIFTIRCKFRTISCLLYRVYWVYCLLICTCNLYSLSDIHALLPQNRKRPVRPLASRFFHLRSFGALSDEFDMHDSTAWESIKNYTMVLKVNTNRTQQVLVIMKIIDYSAFLHSRLLWWCSRCNQNFHRRSTRWSGRELLPASVN